ncbi:uncharacterized protein LOC132176118 [Corylus avellana]|uniref:uncharacterized protein LOC132176118 n=1 Tax=Corylus avellana TaxID=13451 RepID=UPI00286BBD60|nr:uncharacterized protein LOC132176118 [Corylus avellana]
MEYCFSSPEEEVRTLPRKLPRTGRELEPPRELRPTTRELPPTTRELPPTTRELPPTTRELPPTHYIFKIESFSNILTIFPEDKEAKYDSDVFESGGYKWRLSFYPNGRKECNGQEHISLYLAIAETDSLPLGWKVNAICRLFVLDQIRGEYLTLQDANSKVRLFHAMKTEWGFSQFLSLDTFRDPSNGYLVNDSCVLGAEVFVTNYTGKGECLSILSFPITGIRTWTYSKFSTINNEYLTLEFIIGARKWELKLYPRAVSNQDGKVYFRLFLSLGDWEVAPPKGKLYAKYTLRVKDQRSQGKHAELTDYNWFSNSVRGYDYPKFLLQSELKDTSRGFLLNDNLIVEAEIEIISTVKNFIEKK